LIASVRVLSNPKRGRSSCALIVERVVQVRINDLSRAMSMVVWVVVGSAVFLLIGLLACVPLGLPWPQRVRWTATVAQQPGHMGLMMAYPPYDIREVTLRAIRCETAGLTIDVHEAGRAPTEFITITRSTAVEPCVESMLREWLALGTPMVLFIDRNGEALIEGPSASVSGLTTVSTSSSSVWSV
jgi:hypothetical protein